MPRISEALVEVFVITEMKDGAIFKTKYVEDRWVALDAVATPPEMYVPLSTKRTMNRLELGEPLFRSRVVS